MLQSETTTTRIAFAQADNMLNLRPTLDDKTCKSVTFDKTAEMPTFNCDTGKSIEKLQRVCSMPKPSESTKNSVKVLQRS